MLQETLETLRLFFQDDNVQKAITIIMLAACGILVILKANYFNVIIIVKKHVKQFLNHDGKYDKCALAVAFVVPLLLALVTVINENEEVFDNSAFLDGVTLITTILTALFFTIIGLVLDIKIKIKDSNKNATEKAYLNELGESVYNTDMFEILICIVLLLLCFIDMSGVLNSVFLRCGIYCLSYILLINIMMLLKRLYILMERLLK